VIQKVCKAWNRYVIRKEILQHITFTDYEFSIHAMVLCLKKYHNEYSKLVSMKNLHKLFITGKKYIPEILVMQNLILPPFEKLTDFMKYCFGRNYVSSDLSMFKSMADIGYKYMPLIIGDMYLTGDHVINDDGEAFRWFKNSADCGNAASSPYRVPRKGGQRPSHCDFNI
jgi:hypothetical protein